jgi:hypothetical protein
MTLGSARGRGSGSGEGAVHCTRWDARPQQSLNRRPRPLASPLSSGSNHRSPLSLSSRTLTRHQKSQLRRRTRRPLCSTNPSPLLQARMPRRAFRRRSGPTGATPAFCALRNAAIGAASSCKSLRRHRHGRPTTRHAPLGGKARRVKDCWLACWMDGSRGARRDDMGPR